MDPNLESTSEESSTTDEANTATPLDAENQDGATPAENQEAASESSPGADGKETVSEEDFDPLSVVKKAVEGDKKTKEGTGEDQGKQPDDSSKSESDGQKPEDGEDAELGEVTEEELKGYKPATRKRIEGLLDDRKRLTERVEALEPAAEQMETLQNFMEERRLTPQNVSELMVVGGLAMSDDDADVLAAIKRTEEFLGQLKARVGDVLPDDLQAQVDEGKMTAEGAKEVALSRIRNQRADARVENANKQAETAKTEGQQTGDTAKAQVVHQTISDWQQQKAQTDPDYPRKAALLAKEIKLRVAAEGGKVLDPQRAIQIANEAYAEVNTLMQSLAPTKAPEAKKVLQSKGGGSSGNMASKPNSPLEAAKAGLAKTQG